MDLAQASDEPASERQTQPRHPSQYAVVRIGTMSETSVLSTIGNTPLVRLQRCAPANGAELWVKLEYRNPTRLDEGPDGARDDRGRRARRRCSRRATTVVEYTGGSTGPALALVCRAKGYRRADRDRRLLQRGALPAHARARRGARRHPVGRGPPARDVAGHRQHGRSARPSSRASPATTRPTSSTTRTSSPATATRSGARSGSRRRAASPPSATASARPAR